MQSVSKTCPLRFGCRFLLALLIIMLLIKTVGDSKEIAAVSTTNVTAPYE